MPQAADPPDPVRSDSPEPPWRVMWTRYGVGVSFTVVLALLALVAMPPGEGLRTPVYDVGAVADETVIAPFAFRVPRPEPEVERERARARDAVPPLFVFDAAALDTVRARVLRLGGALDSVRLRAESAGQQAARQEVLAIAEREGVSLTEEEADWLTFASRRAALLTSVRRVFERTLPDGVAASRALDALPPFVRVSRGGEERGVSTDALQSWSDVLRVARALHPEPTSRVADGAYQHLLTGLFTPSLRFDSLTMAERRAEADATIQLWRFEVRSGEKIVGAHEVVREEDRARLLALREITTAGAGGAADGWRHLGAFLLDLAVLAVLVVTLAWYRPEVYRQPRAMLVIGLAIAVVLLGTGLALRQSTVPGALIPIGAAALLISILFDSRIALVCALVLALLVGVQPAFRTGGTLFFVLAGGAAAAFSVRALERRTQFVSSILALVSAYVAAALVAGLALGWPVSEVLTAAALGGANAVVSVALAMALHPAAEELCGVDTYLKLLEWSDLNRPLLRRLAIEAPGTWAHTLAMANLVEAAARAVGANALLARVGTYYHDVGKLDKPGYFVENQGSGRNPHDALAPAASAAIIRNHVRVGLALAAEHRVPRAIEAFIAEHHGTGPISYFLEKARERNETVSGVGEFAYPGPRPRSIETAICMLADGVEAAARVLTDHSPARLREVVDGLVNARIAQGQLRDAPITLQQLEIVQHEFVRVLGAMRHARIEYPGPDGVTDRPRADRLPQLSPT
jgi:putative nucleotidyltransferase with HDIG domain